MFIFDLDKTIIRIDCEYYIYRIFFGKKYNKLYNNLIKKKTKLQKYIYYIKKIYKYKNIIKKFIYRIFLKSINKKIILIINKLKNKKKHIIISTSSNYTIVNMVKKILNIDKIFSTVTKGKNIILNNYKRNKFNNLIKYKNISAAFFFTDSINDIYLLKNIRNKIIINPNTKLYNISKKNNWVII